MLKHCSTSCVDVSRRSLRHSSLTLDQDQSSVRSGVQWSQLRSQYCISLSTLSTPAPSETTSVSSSSSDTSDLEPGGDHRSGQLTIRVYATCLRPHLAYKTIMIKTHTTSRQVISSLLTRFRMRHRDQKLYYLTMEVTVNNSLQTITLEDNSRPSELISCNPWGGCKFILRSKTGGRIKIYDDQIRADSVYKSIIISRETSVADTLDILLTCYPSLEHRDLSLYEVDSRTGDERLLEHDQCPLLITEEWSVRERQEQVINNKRLVVRYSETKRVTPQHFSDENGFIIVRREDISDHQRSVVRRDSFIRHSDSKKHFLRSMINLSSGLKMVDINIDNDSLGDNTETGSDTSSELVTSEEEYHSTVNKTSDDSARERSVIIESFFT